jgi:hypothetical protein
MSGLLIALVLFTILGAGRSWGSRWLSGAAIAGTVLFYAGLLNIPLQIALWVLIAGGMVASLFLHRKAEVVIRYPPLATLLMTIPVMVVFLSAMTIPLNDFDGRVFWVLKAKAIAHENSVDGPFFRGQTTYSPRNRYPLLVPLDDAALMMLTRTLDDKQVRGFYALTFLAFLLVLRRSIATRFAAETGAWCAAVVAWVPQLFVIRDGGATSAYNDIPLAAFAACALLELMPPDSSARFGLWLAAMTLTKSEGVVYAGVLFVCGLWLFRARILPAAAQFGLAIGALSFWRMHLRTSDEEDFLGRVQLLPERLGRLRPALGGITAHALHFPVWGLFWVSVGVAACVSVKRRELLAPVVIAAMLAIYVAVYMVTFWDLKELLSASADRLLAQLAGPASIVLAAAVSAPRSSRNR